MESGRELISRIEALIGSEAASYEARVVAEDITGDSYSELMTNGYELTSRQEDKIDGIIKQRNSGVPLAYILKSITFRELDIYVDERVLIPRSETEIVVQHAVDILRPLGDETTVVDMCTGSGAIALSIAHEVVGSRVYATDISADAIDVARLNGTAVGSPARRVQYFCGDLFEPLPESIKGNVDLIISNPPYIGEDETNEVESSVLLYEPHVALFAGETGFEIYERIICEARGWLKDGGNLVLEISPRHVDAIKKCGTQNSYSTISIYDDLVGRERVAILSF